MRPIAALTVAAREIATTRDPSRRLPMPETEDEVAELAQTLDEMLGELDAARSETQQMIQAQRDFVADASHELRTPLTSILANLELLEARPDREADPEQAEIVVGALGSSRRMRRLVSDLLLLARADAGRSGPRRICDLTSIASEAATEVRPVAEHHRLELAADGAIEVEGNSDDLHRLVVNLIENAVRHTPAGSVVTIGTRQAAGLAVLEVGDDGPGIPAGLEEQVFARFVRADGPADLSSGSGTGLGLAIVRAVAVSHGGAVEVGRSPLGGALFTVRLPLAPVQSPDGEAGAGSTGDPARTAHA
jgi:signal transduction histidine kinase